MGILKLVIGRRPWGVALVVTVCATFLIALPGSASAGTTNPFLGRIDATSIGSPLTPTAVATAPGDRVYVGDSATGNVYALGSAGTLLFPFEASAAPSGALSAESIAVGPGGNVYIPEPFGQHEVNRFDSAGHFLGVFSSAPGNIFQPFVSSVAVDGEGNIYTVEGGEISKSTSSESFVTQWFAGAVGVAVSPAGEVFAVGPNSVQRFTTNGTFLSAVGSADIPGGSSTFSGVALAPDGDFYVSDSQAGAIYHFAPSNEYLGRANAASLPAGTPFSPTGLAVDSGGNLYAVDPPAEAVIKFGPAVRVPAPTPGTVDQLGNGAVTLHGAVNPEGLAVSECVFEYAPEGSNTFESLPCVQSASEIGTGTSSVPVDAELSGPPSGLYVFRLKAANVNGPITSSQRNFSVGRPPSVESESADSTSLHEASITAKVNPGALEASFNVEFGTTSNYGSTSPVRQIHLGDAPVLIQVFLGELQPITTYHFRVVAENELGRTAGPDQTFTTGAVADVCPNALFRVGSSAALPECRAYEQVTPVQKNGMYIGGVGFQALPSGNGLVYTTNSTPGGPESESAPRNSRYEAIRANGGWQMRIKLDLPIIAPVSITSKSTLAVSEDLSHALVASDRALTPGAYEAGCNLYLRDVETGQLTLIGASPEFNCYQKFAGLFQESSTFIGGTSDFSAISFLSPVPLLPEALPEVIAAYEWSSASGLTLSSRLPNGEPINGAASPNGSYEPEFHKYSPVTRTTLIGVGNGVDSGVYARLASGRTIALSVSQAPGAPSTPHPGQAIGISRSGRYAMFLTTDTVPLTEDAPVASGNLYRYDFETGKLEALGIQGVFETNIAATSEELNAIYWQQFGEMKVWWNGHISTIGPYSLPAYYPGFNVSPNGRYFAFAATNKVTAFENEGLSEVYLYDAVTEELHCASCPGPGLPLDGEATLPGNQQEIDNNRIPKAVTDAGQVFFNSTNQLVRSDTNGLKDVYEYRDGKQLLISPGDSNFGALFVEAGLDSRDVFIKTAQSLVPSDTDKSYDIYDARIGGGLASQYEPRPSPCSGEDCQGANAPSKASAIATESTGGQGKARSRSARCKKTPKNAKSGKGCSSRKSKPKKKHRHRRVHGADRSPANKANKVNGGHSK